MLSIVEFSFRSTFSNRILICIFEAYIQVRLTKFFGRYIMSKARNLSKHVVNSY